MLFYDGTEEEYYEHINQNIKMSLILMEGNYVAIDSDYYSCHG